MNRGEEEGSEREASEHHKRLRHQREGAEEWGGVLSEDAAPFWFGYSTVASLGAFEEWALRLSSATRKASSSSLDSWAMFHTWASITGQNTSNVIAVGMACWPKMPTPASIVVPFATGSIFMFRAVFIPMMALKVPPLRMLTCTPPMEIGVTVTS